MAEAWYTDCRVWGREGSGRVVLGRQDIMVNMV